MITILLDIKQSKIMHLHVYDCNSRLIYLLLTYSCLNIQIYSPYCSEYLTYLY